MLQKIKKFLKRFLPMSARISNGKFEEITALVSSQSAESKNDLQKLSEKLEQSQVFLATLLSGQELERQLVNQAQESAKQSILQVQAAIERAQEALTQSIIHAQESQNQLSAQAQELLKQSTLQAQELIKQTASQVQSAQKQLFEKLQKSITEDVNCTKTTLESVNETVWAQVFNNTISGSNWLLNRSISPGRWAVGYQYLYVLYRALNEVKPKNILELGLGQSTRLIAQYAQHHPDVAHQVVEHDLGWIDFFSRDFSLGEATKLVVLPLETEAFKGDNVPVYSGFANTFMGQRFDLISIDAPFGYLSEIYSRIDVFKLLPDCLADSFVILIDDYNRPGERQTVELIKKLFEENRIAYKIGVYNGKKSTCVIVSTDLGFVCTM